ncbi:MAG: hypothetical protein PHZ19_08190 [Candidatus Thermoplasmatota archaeon]|nr:hypothetical protein [Candidatus Thermoplasmatota archaeon]
MPWYDSDNLIDPNRTLLWTLSAMRAAVRKLVGLPMDYQLSNSDIDGKLNNFYQNLLPVDLKPEALDSWYVFDTQANVDTQVIAEGVLDLRQPVTIDGYPAIFTKNDEYFYQKFPETQTYTAQRPSHVLQRGKLLIFRPEPDAVYQFKAPAYIKPAALSLDTDTPMQDQWGPYIVYGTAIDILSDRGDMQRMAQLTPIFNQTRSFALRGDLIQKTHERSTPRW